MSTNRYIFNYDYTHPAWKNHEDLLVHNGQECCVVATDFGLLDIAKAVFDDGFESNVFIYELERIK